MFSQTEVSVKKASIQVVASIFPLAEFAKNVCGEKGRIEVLLPPGADIHTWRPKPSDLFKLAKADLFIYIGANLEPWLHDILMAINNPKLQVLEVSKGLSLIDGQEHQGENHTHKTFDPHVWLDFSYDI